MWLWSDIKFAEAKEKQELIGGGCSILETLLGGEVLAYTNPMHKPFAKTEILISVWVSVQGQGYHNYSY